MKTLLNSLIKKPYRKRRSPIPKPNSGFTMIELLVATIMATIIIVPMLTFMVDILNRDVREQAKTNTQQDLQAAIDYIAQDMSQAVYVYDSSKDNDGNYNDTDYADFADQLKQGTSEVRPVLVFWKRQIVENALPVDVSNDNCPSSTRCDDAYVMSLVAYYLLPGEAGIWCQPEGGTCPKRIARFQIQDGVKATNTNGTYQYLCDFYDCTNNKEAEKDKGFNNPIYSTAWTRDGAFDNNNTPIVLVNYIDKFEVDEVRNNELAKITIIGNALRRRENDFSCIEDASATPPTYKDSPYCPKVTAQVGARSGFGGKSE